MKTIKELNSRWWYRLAKVAFLILFVFLSFVVINGVQSEIYSHERKIDLDKSYLLCKDGNSKKYSFSEINRLFGSDEYYQKIDEPSTEPKLSIDSGGRLNSFSSIASARIVGELCLIEEYINQKKESNSGGYTPITDSNSKWLEKINESYLLEKIYSEKDNLVTTYLVLAVVFFGVILLFECMRRLFYYIVLGSFKPKKE